MLFYVHCNPITRFDPLGLEWQGTAEEGNAYAYNRTWYGGSEDAVLLGSVTADTIDVLTGSGRIVRQTSYTVAFTHNDGSYEIDLVAMNTALKNIPGDLADKLHDANPADRASMIKDFLTTPVEASGSTKAKVAGVIDAGVSRVAGITAFGNQSMNNHGQGGIAQMLMGVDSRDPTYLDRTKNNDRWIAGGGAGFSVAATLTIGPRNTMGPQAKFNRARSGHTFKTKADHVKPSMQTSRNRYINLFEQATTLFNQDESALTLRTQGLPSGAGFVGYTKAYNNGTIWVQTRNGEIQNAGVRR